MLNRKIEQHKKIEKKKIFYSHYFKMLELSEFANEKINGRLDAIDSIKHFFQKNYVLANIPEKYMDFELENIKDKILINDDNKEAIDIITKFIVSLDNVASKGIGLYISGPHGVAKTTLSTIILKEAIRKYYRCFFCKAHEIIDFARSGWKNEDRKRFWDYVANTVDFFVIDDIVRAYQGSESERMHLDEIFTKRDDSNLSTIITANHDLDTNQDLFGPALYSNFKERLIEVKINGDDFRNIINQTLISQL